MVFIINYFYFSYPHEDVFEFGQNARKENNEVDDPLLLSLRTGDPATSPGNIVSDKVLTFTTPTDEPDPGSLEYAVKQRAESPGLVVLPCCVDMGYAPMAYNIYLTSLVRFSITNFLFICIHREACQYLWDRDVPAYLYLEDAAGNSTHDFMSEGFNKKSSVKLYLVKDILHLGYDIFITDLDNVFLSNPIQWFCDDCDINVMFNQVYKGNEVFNGGFYFVRNTDNTREMFKLATQMRDEFPLMVREQEIYNKAIHTMNDTSTNNFIIKRLPLDKFLTGKFYFDEKRYFFDTKPPCETCVVVHNNFIEGIEAKEYRFKEHLMWLVDDDGYYSHTSRRYLLYSNPLHFGKSAHIVERASLRSALAIGQLLNRTVILPRFNCPCSGDKTYKCHFECPLHYKFKVAKFEQHFKGQYRESSFLHNPLVPENMVAKNQNPSSLFVIINKKHETLITESLETLQTEQPGIDIQKIYPANSMAGASSDEIISWFASLDHVQVLHFHSLYGAFDKFTDTNENTAFAKKIDDGLRRSDQLQREKYM